MVKPFDTPEVGEQVEVGDVLHEIDNEAVSIPLTLNPHLSLQQLQRAKDFYLESQG